MTAQAGSRGRWDFHNPVRIHFGRGCRERLVAELAGRRCLIVTSRRGRDQLSADSILGPFAEGAHRWVDSVTANPGIAELQSEIDRLRSDTFDAVIGFGGGSALDSAKVLAVALGERKAPHTLVELLADPALHSGVQTPPLYAVPTTAGTGSEATPYATVWDHGRKKKHSLAGRAAFPHTAVVDPALTDGVPTGIALSTGLDAINQAAESIWNRNATPLTLAIATRALRLGFEALPHLVEEGGDEADRDAMAECSLLAGMAISQTRTALCHSISYPLTAHFGVPHGLACAFTMPAVLRLNLAAEDGRFANLAKALFGETAGLEELVAGFERLHERLEVARRVQAYIPDHHALLGVADEMYTPDRAGNNLVDVDPTLISDVLERALQP